MSEKRQFGILLPAKNFPHLDGQTLTVFLSPRIDMEDITIFSYEQPAVTNPQPMIREADHAEVYEKASND